MNLQELATTTGLPLVRELDEDHPVAVWCQALRSGVYYRAEGYLKRRRAGFESTLHCCLGVACELFDPQALVLGSSDAEALLMRRDADTVDWTWYVMIDGSPHSAALPESVSQLLDLSQDDCDTLAILNDHDWSFRDIADLLEFSYRTKTPVSDLGELL